MVASLYWSTELEPHKRLFPYTHYSKCLKVGIHVEMPKVAPKRPFVIFKKQN